MFRPLKHFGRTLDAAQPNFGRNRDFKATITMKEELRLQSKFSLLYSLGLITHFPPVSKSASQRARTVPVSTGGFTVIDRARERAARGGFAFI